MQKCLYKTGNRINFSTGLYMLHLQLIGCHFLRYMYRISIIFTPVMMKQPVFVTFIDRRSRHKIHTLNQSPLDIMFDYKISKLFSRPYCMIICPQDKQSSDTEAVSLNILNGFYYFVFTAFFTVPKAKICNPFPLCDTSINVSLKLLIMFSANGVKTPLSPLQWSKSMNVISLSRTNPKPPYLPDLRHCKAFS